jgi:hypothetical protein
MAFNVTLKKSYVAPDACVPYFILLCFTKSSTELMGVISLSNVKHAARFAVYVDIIMSVKNHQALARTLPESDLKEKKTH